MKAMTAARYGGPEVMQLQDLPTPAIGDEDVLVAVRATSLQALDWHLLRADPAIVRLGEGLFRPKRTIHGVDIAGIVEAVGAGVDDLEPGDEIFGWSDDGGGLAEYIALPRDHVRPRPQNLTLEEAATVGVAVQLCKATGAHVTGVSSTRNLDLVRTVGADDVVDRNVDDWSAMDRTWDVILQVTGSIRYARARRVLAADGRYVMAGVNADGRILGPMLPFLRLMVRSRFDRRARTVRAVENADDLRALAELVETGSLRPAIDRRFTLAEAADAMRFVEEGRAAGKIVVTV